MFQQQNDHLNLHLIRKNLKKNKCLYKLLALPLLTLPNNMYLLIKFKFFFLPIHYNGLMHFLYLTRFLLNKKIKKKNKK